MVTQSNSVCVYPITGKLTPPTTTKTRTFVRGTQTEQIDVSLLVSIYPLLKSMPELSGQNTEKRNELAAILFSQIHVVVIYFM